MLWNMLASEIDKTRSVAFGEAALYALLGFMMVFLGITILIFVVWVVGKIMTKVTALPPKASIKDSKTKEANTQVAIGNEEDISEETVAAITAAIMAYYQQEQAKCEFKVRRIKKV